MILFKNAIYRVEQDKQLVEKAIDYNIWLLCGNNVAKKEELKKIFINKCEKVCTIAEGDNHPILNNNTLGYCSSDEEQNYTVEFYGFGNSKNLLKTIHQGVHEFCHAMQHVASYILRDRNLDYMYNDCEYSTHGATILEKKLHPKPNEEKYSNYGLFFCETITDLLTSVELFYLDGNYTYNNITADQILKDNYNALANSNLQKNGYSLYLSIARLAIAAFSNVGNISYDQIIKSGNSIILEKKNGKPVNDLLYGIMCDARYVEEEYDKIMGNNSYYKLCSKLDKMLKKKNINSAEVKEVMTTLSIFHNRKKEYLLSQGVPIEELIKMTNDFNLVFNNLQKEYNAYFTNNDVNKIANSLKQ